jgi:hypothetical protein
VSPIHCFGKSRNFATLNKETAHRYYNNNQQQRQRQQQQQHHHHHQYALETALDSFKNSPTAHPERVV